MGYGDEKVVVEVKERDDKALEHIGKDGKARVYYPARRMWLNVQRLQVWQQMQEGSEGGSPSLVSVLNGEAALEDYGLSIIGEPENKTRTVRVSFKVGELSPPFPEEEAAKVLELGFIRAESVGAAWLGFSRQDWEIGNPNEWWLSCQVSSECFQALKDGVASVSLTGIRLGLQLRDLYTDEHPMAPVSVSSHLFLRPSKVDGTISWPQVAVGYVIHLSMSLAQVVLQPSEPAAEDDARETMAVREAALDPTAQAVVNLTTAVLAFRGTVKWVGGIIAACLVVLALK